MTISLEDVRVYAGDAAAYVTCIEVMDAGDSRGRCAALCGGVSPCLHALLHAQTRAISMLDTVLWLCVFPFSEA